MSRVDPGVVDESEKTRSGMVDDKRKLGDRSHRWIRMFRIGIS